MLMLGTAICQNSVVVKEQSILRNCQQFHSEILNEKIHDLQYLL